MELILGMLVDIVSASAGTIVERVIGAKLLDEAKVLGGTGRGDGEAGADTALASRSKQRWSV